MLLLLGTESPCLDLELFDVAPSPLVVKDDGSVSIFPAVLEESSEPD